MKPLLQKQQKTTEMSLPCGDKTRLFVLSTWRSMWKLTKVGQRKQTGISQEGHRFALWQIFLSVYALWSEYCSVISQFFMSHYLVIPSAVTPEKLTGTTYKEDIKFACSGELLSHSCYLLLWEILKRFVMVMRIFTCKPLKSSPKRSMTPPPGA